jgi:organic hydroperoxide reductase OsmC/OhrA
VKQEDIMPSAFPHHYDVEIVSGKGAAVLRGGQRPPIVGGPPPQFDGREDWWSPEHLLLSSVALCLMTTFQAVAARAGLTVDGYRTRAEGLLDRTPAGLAFTSIRLAVDLKVAEPDQVRAEQLLQTAKRHCIVANALKVGVEMETVVTAAA